MSTPQTGQNFRVDANSTMWRLRSLTALGHNPARIARALGCTARVVRRVVDGRSATVAEAFRRDVMAVWESWWCLRPPEYTRQQRTAATAARNRAQREDWPCPLGLDEGHVEEPGYKPTARYRSAAGLGIADDYPLADRRIAS